MTKGTYASIVRDHLVESYDFDDSRADKAMKEWSQLVQASWASNRNARGVARSVASFDAGVTPARMAVRSFRGMIKKWAEKKGK